MKIEKLSKGKSRKIVLSIIILLFIIGIIYITNSKAKYQVTKNVQIVNGNVNYSLADLNVLALKVQSAKGSETYNPTETVPSGNYEVNTTRSYCKYPGDDTEYKDIPMKYESGRVSISINKKNSKCYVYLDISNQSERTLDNLDLVVSQSGCPAEEDPTINAYTGTGLLCKGEDDDGPTYYFRGNVTNNWVQMGDTYWRIIRINGDGTIRLIYNGTSTATSGTSTQYKTSVFNTTVKAEFVGLKYTEGVRNGLTTESTILGVLNTFYMEEIAGIYADKLDHNAGFCGDRTSTTVQDSQTLDNTGGVGDTETYYGGSIRFRKKMPTFKCPEPATDLYTIRTAIGGNHALDRPVGLITSDEVMYAGGSSSSLSGYWLYTGQYYWTMTPYDFKSGEAQVFFVWQDGKLSTRYNIAHTYGVRPVINLKSDTILIGGGTANNPFVVQL